MSVSASPWKSRWSGSRLVTTRECGAKARNEPSDSSASTTARPVPPPGVSPGTGESAHSPALRPRSGTAAPSAHAGSRRAPRSAATAMPVVVVLPWVPATAISSRSASSPASAAARWMTGRPRSRAARTSGLSARTAVETMTRSTSSASRAASKPMPMRAPAARSGAMNWPSWESEPLTASPDSSARRATALIPAPPMRTTCTERTADSEGQSSRVITSAGRRIVRGAACGRGPFSRPGVMRSR